MGVRACDMQLGRLTCRLLALASVICASGCLRSASLSERQRALPVSSVQTGGTANVAVPILTPEEKALCESFRAKKGLIRTREAHQIHRGLLQKPLPVAVVVDLLGEPDSRSESFLTYALGFDGQVAHTMHLSIEEGRASVFGFGGGG